MTEVEQNAYWYLYQFSDMQYLPRMMAVFPFLIGIPMVWRLLSDRLHRRPVGAFSRVMRGIVASGLLLLGILCAIGFPVPVESCKVAARNPEILAGAKPSRRGSFSLEHVREACGSKGVTIGDVAG